jgi:D-alanyl-D-alanine endopeptidase (penicillin-binding protein 7)
MKSSLPLSFMLGLLLMLGNVAAVDAARESSTRAEKTAVSAKATSATKAKSVKKRAVRQAKKARPAVRKQVAFKPRAARGSRAARAASVLALPAAAVTGSAALADEGAVDLDARGLPQLGSSAFYVANQATGEVLLERNSHAVLPIASITKLMTAMVVLDSGLSLSEELVISAADIDTLKGTGSRLGMGTRLTREEMLNLALMSSENRAASALARHYPGGESAFIAAMNIKARMLSLNETQFHDSTGLTPANVSSPRDLAKMVAAAAAYPLIREFSTMPERLVEVGARHMRFGNTNALVKSPEWQIAVQKTGYISEAGRCLVMQAWMQHQPVVIVLMDSAGRYTRTADAQRVRKWLESSGADLLAEASRAPRRPSAI